MKYQRNGKTYDTETARMVLAADNGKAAASPQFFRQTLYRKRTGEFFLHCEGGSESPAARFTRPGQSKPLAGELIQPVSSWRNTAASASERCSTSISASAPTK